MFKLDKGRATFRITKYLFFVITLWNVLSCECRHIYSLKGQSAQLNFTFPCNSTEVTLQQANSLPFYRSTDGFVLSLPQNQTNRFNVQINIENENCSLDLTVRDIKAIDQGTYLSTIYMDGHLFDEFTTRIWLRVDIPPDKASCVKVQDKGGDWVSIDCTANVGNVAGKIECYQNGTKMLSVIDPAEIDSSVTESFLIRKSQPAFCCSSTLNEYKERCECNDAALNLADGDSNDPCPPSSTITTRPIISIVTENNQADSTGESYTPINLKECKSNKCAIMHSVLFPTAVFLFLWTLFVLYKKKVKTTMNRKSMMQCVRKGKVKVNGEGVIISFAENQHDPSHIAT